MMIKLLLLIFLISACFLTHSTWAHGRVTSPMIDGSESSEVLVQGNQHPGLNATTELGGRIEDGRKFKELYGKRSVGLVRKAVAGGGVRGGARGGSGFITRPRGMPHSGASATPAFPSFLTSNTLMQGFDVKLIDVNQTCKVTKGGQVVKYTTMLACGNYH